MRSRYTRAVLFASALTIGIWQFSCSNVPQVISPICNAATGVCKAATAICELIVQDTTSVETLQIAQQDLESKLYALRVEAMRVYTLKHRSDSLRKKIE